jgi:cbb3-type cytochrome oxidase maturation protein
MIIIILLIGISLTIAVIFLAIFLWNMRSGQYDDTYTPSIRMLFDGKPTRDTVKSTRNNETQKSVDGNASDAFVSEH